MKAHEQLQINDLHFNAFLENIQASFINSGAD